MADAPDPPRKFYRLKPTEFERLNALGPAPSPDAASSAAEAAPPPAPETPGAPAAVPRPPGAAPIDVRELARLGTQGSPALGGNAPVTRPNDVHAILRGNVAHADAAGLNEVAPAAPRRSRRRRDFVLLMLPVNAFFAWWAFGPWSNPMTFVYGIAGMVIYSLGLWWVMYQVMNDY